MIEFTKKSQKKNLILFVHGFTGGSETWKNSEHGYYYDQLATNNFVENNFDIAKFEYFSKLLNIFVTGSSAIEWIANLFTTKIAKSEKNLGISELADLLRTQIRFVLKDYENIVVIAHSMGGLVAKACVIEDINKYDQTKIKLMISLAVPHLGTDIATYSSLLSGNLQTKDLTPLGKFLPDQNNQWLRLENKPPIKYFYGTYDDVVKKESAIGTDAVPQDTIACNDNHTTICKPAGNSSIAIIAVIDFLEEFVKSLCGESLDFHKLDNDAQFSDEYFALKLIVAGVHTATVKHSKEHFLNAEYARKFFSSSADQKKLADLYSKIRTVYQDCYDSHVGNDEISAGKLVAKVHKKIVSEDAGYLKSALPLIQALHKKGMLHQLANDMSDDIWWNDDRSIEALESIKNISGNGSVDGQ
ncbi:ABC-three component system protein [Janthinobacterium sp.]|uniref:ABC-three component system protein n=1 Tax=Janthinobacterium sp. TaxID=1871054 RepID=UPI00293D2791|nr:ABC-three component system protein [Janthinobacterium sp.]